MPPRSTTPSDDGDDDFASMKDAMTSSPIAPPAEKRTHSTMVNGDDDAPPSDNELPATPALPATLINQNVVTSARQYGQRKRLRADQITEMEIFLAVSCTAIGELIAVSPSRYSGPPVAPKREAVCQYLGVW